MEARATRVSLERWLRHEGGQPALLAASSLTAALKRKARPAASMACEWVRLISNCEPSNSWLPLLTPMSRSRSSAQGAQQGGCRRRRAGRRCRRRRPRRCGGASPAGRRGPRRTGSTPAPVPRRGAGRAGAAVDDGAQQVAGRLGRRPPGGRVGDVAEAGGDAGFPRQRGEGVEVGAYADAGQAGVQPAGDRPRRPAGRCGRRRGRRRGRVVAGRGQVVEQDAAGPVGADEVGVGHPDHVPMPWAASRVPCAGGRGAGCAHRCLLCGKAPPSTRGAGEREGGRLRTAAGAGATHLFDAKRYGRRHLPARVPSQKFIHPDSY